MTYDFDGNQYRQASTHQKEWGAKLISELKLQGHERILDLGCGDGELTAQLAAAVPFGAVLGIDASEAMLAEAGKHRRPNLSFRLLDIREMEFDAEFEVVFSNATLQWVKDHRAMLRGVHRALREGGVARFQFAGDGNCSNLIRVVREVMACDQFISWFATFEWPWYMPTVESYRQLLAPNGFLPNRS